MEKHRSIFIASLILALSACTAGQDMQGYDPVAYYSQHPIENKVESRRLSELAHFMPAAAALSDDEADRLHEALQPVSPPAVDSITIRLAEGDRFQLAREDALARLLKKMGYGKIRFEPSADVKRGDAAIDVAYLAVVPPDCPDWRMSPVTSYSNTWQGNFHCATTTNIGMMVEDPHDLVRGTGDVPIDTARSSKVVQDYNGGKDFMPGTTSAGTAGGSSGSSGASSGASGMNSATGDGASALGGGSQ